MYRLGLGVLDRRLDVLEVVADLANDGVGVGHEADVAGAFDALEAVAGNLLGEPLLATGGMIASLEPATTRVGASIRQSRSETSNC